ncbi:hypothetical protein [Streptomyces sp. BF23-19]|uniref:hypothetical protein n=1 Tax=Streptomyces sp. BF23-19 TaxID=3240283 RepID=UPI0034E3B3E0
MTARASASFSRGTAFSIAAHASTTDTSSPALGEDAGNLPSPRVHRLPRAPGRRARTAWADPSTPAFVGIDRHGHITGGLVPDSVTRAVKRISARAGVPISWTGHSLRIGLASTGRKRGKDAIAIADQGGWARHSRSMLGYGSARTAGTTTPPPASPESAAQG